MALGVRSSALILGSNISPGVQPQSLSSYDPITRRNTILTLDIVPNVKNDQYSGVPADRYAHDVGLSPAGHPIWGTAGTGTQTWDSTNKRFYIAVAGTTYSWGSTLRLTYPTGVGGASPAYAPKNVSVTKAQFNFTMRWADNVNYSSSGNSGIGLTAKASSQYFSGSADHYIYFYRDTGNWVLKTCDASTASTSTSATADGNWHAFMIEWEVGTVRLYVDGALVITKTTNLPTQALACRFETQSRNVDFAYPELEWAA